MEADAAPNSERGPGPEEGAWALAEFVALHGPALRASGVPERYWGRLLHKLEHEVRAGAARGGRGAWLGALGFRAGPGRAGGGLLRTLLLGRVWSAGWPLDENCWGLRVGKPGWFGLEKAGGPPGGHVLCSSALQGACPHLGRPG